MTWRHYDPQLPWRGICSFEVLDSLKEATLAGVAWELPHSVSISIIDRAPQTPAAVADAIAAGGPVAAYASAMLDMTQATELAAWLKHVAEEHAPVAITFRPEPDDGTRWTVEVTNADPDPEKHARAMLRMKLVQEGPLPTLVRVETRRDA